MQEGFPGGSVVKNSPANARDMGLIADPGRSHKPRSNEAQEPQLPNLRSTPHAATAKAQAPRAGALSKGSRHKEKPGHCSEDPAQPKIKIMNKLIKKFLLF